MYPGWNEYEYLNHPLHSSVGSCKVTGVYVLPDFISDDEERQLILDLDSLPWDVSQSGRRKQVNTQLSIKNIKLPI